MQTAIPAVAVMVVKINFKQFKQLRNNFLIELFSLLYELLTLGAS